MLTQVQHQDAFPLLAATLQHGEGLHAEAGTMVARHPEVRIEIALDLGGEGGVWKRLVALAIAVVRKLVGGEHLFVNRFVSTGVDGGWVWVAPAFAGDVQALHVGPTATWTLAPGAYLASARTVRLRTRWTGWAALFSKAASYWVEVDGEGEVWVAAQGAIDTIDIDGSHLVDAGHLIAFGPGLRPRVRGHGRASWASRAEGLVVELKGRGQALVQGRSTRSLIGYLTPLLPE